MDKDAIIKAGDIAKKVKVYARELVKPNMPLLELASKIEEKIIELGGKLAFPCNLSINEIAAHYTPSHDDTTLATGLLKIDFGVHVNGWTADTAFSVDLENNEKNKKLIVASRVALEMAQNSINSGVKAASIGKIISKTITNNGANPIINLSGHQMNQYELHCGNSIPNIDDDRVTILEPGLYAIEPFATFGSGKVRDGKPSGIYQLESDKPIRSPIAREVLNYIIEEYKTLPFCSRWLVKKFGTKALFGLNQLEKNGNLHHFAQLIEVSNNPVSQAENTVILDDKTIVTTE